MTSHHLQSRGILECVNWSCRPAAASLPPGRVLEKKTKILNDGATTRNWDEMSSKSKIKDGDSRVSFFFLQQQGFKNIFHLSASLPSPTCKTKTIFREALPKLQMCCCISATATSSSGLLGSLQLRAMAAEILRKQVKNPLAQRPSSLKDRGTRGMCMWPVLVPR